MDYIAVYYVGKVEENPVKQLKDLREYLRGVKTDSVRKK